MGNIHTIMALRIDTKWLYGKHFVCITRTHTHTHTHTHTRPKDQSRTNDCALERWEKRCLPPHPPQSLFGVHVVLHSRISGVLGLGCRPGTAGAKPECRNTCMQKSIRHLNYVQDSKYYRVFILAPCSKQWMLLQVSSRGPTPCVLSWARGPRCEFRSDPRLKVDFLELILLVHMQTVLPPQFSGK